MDKTALIEKIGQLEGQIARDELDLKKWDRLQDRIERDKALGVAAMVAAVVLVAILGSSALLGGVVLFLVGLVLLIPAVGNQSKATWLIEATRDRIVANRQELGVLQARLVAG